MVKMSVWLTWVLRIASIAGGAYLLGSASMLDATCVVCAKTKTCDPGSACTLRHVAVVAGALLILTWPTVAVASKLRRRHRKRTP